MAGVSVASLRTCGVVLATATLLAAVAFALYVLLVGRVSSVQMLDRWPLSRAGDAEAPIRYVARDTSWDRLEHRMLPPPHDASASTMNGRAYRNSSSSSNYNNSSSSNGGAGDVALSVGEIAIIVPHLIAPHREVHRAFWSSAGADVHLFAVNAITESVTHVRSGAQWPRYTPPASAHRNSVHGAESGRRQARQFADFYQILTFVERERCFGAPLVMLSDDDVRPCPCLAEFVRRLLRWLDDVPDWRVARFSIGTNGLVVPCALLGALTAFLGERWRGAAPEHRNFTHAIDFEIALWAMPYQQAPIAETHEYTLRYALLRHEPRGASTLWNGDHVAARAVPLCMDPIVWGAGDGDRQVWYDRASFDTVRCRDHIVSPCLRADTPRRPTSADEAHALHRCDAGRAHRGSVDSIGRVDLHMLLAVPGETCTRRCARAARRCDASAAAALSNVDNYALSAALPSRCLLTMSHDSELGPAVSLPTMGDLAFDERPPLCTLEVIARRCRESKKNETDAAAFVCLFVC